MDELLAKLLEAEILTEDTKAQLKEAFATQLTEALAIAREEESAKVRAELTEAWITERDNLVDAIDSQVNKFLEAEMAELRGGISAFRDLEVEYSQKLVEAKQEMTLQLESDLAQLVDRLDTFLEMRLSAEFTELKESIDEARKLDFGRRVFEAFMPEYRKHFVDATKTESELSESVVRNEELSRECVELSKQLEQAQRHIKMESVLRPLTGKSRDVMETILKTVPTEQLEEAYANFVGRVVKESVDTATSEKETSVLAESSKDEKPSASDVVVKTGDVVVEGVTRTAEQSEQSSVVRDMLRLAGIQR